MNRRLRSKRLERVKASKEKSLPDGVVKRIDFDDSFVSERGPQGRGEDAFTLIEPSSQGALDTPTKEALQQNAVFDQVLLKTYSVKNHKNQNETRLDHHLDKTSLMNGSTSNVERAEDFVSAKDFFSQRETRESLTSDYYSETDTKSKLRESTRRLSLQKPYNQYIVYSSDEELEEWWQQPKTDYTYSASLSYRETVTPERRIGSPNMSRRGLRGSSTGTLTSSPFTSSPATVPDSLSLRSRRIPRGGLGALSDESDVEESQISEVDENVFSGKFHSLRASRSLRETRSVQATVITSSSLKYGLDGSTSSDEESPTSHFARPIVRRGVTSFLRNAATPNNLSETSNYAKISANGKANTRIANHVHSSSHTSTSSYTRELASQESRNSFYQRIINWKGSKTLYTLVDRFSEWSRSSWSGVREYSIHMFMSLMLWLTTVVSTTKRRLAQWGSMDRSHRVRKFGNEMSQSKKTTTTVTTTTIMSRRQRVYRFMEDGLAWYSGRRRRSPCLWTWIPLLLLLLALLLLIPWLVSLSGRDDSSSSSSNLSSTWPSSSFLSSAVDWLQFGAAFVYQTTNSVGTMMVDWVVSLLIFMKDLFINLVFGVRFVLGYIWTVGGSYLASVSNLVSGSSSAEGKASVSDSQHWAKAYSPLPVIYSGYAIALDGVKYVGSSSWVLITEAASYAGSGLAFAGSAVASAFMTILHLITSAFSSLWLFVVYLLNGVGNAFSKFSFSPSKYESVSIPVAKAPSSFHESSKLSSEELVTKVLSSPQLQSFIALNLKENLNVDTNEALKESLSSVVKLNVETEMNRMKSDILATQSASEGAFFAAKEEDIRSLRNQQQDLIGQLRGMEATLAKLMTSQQDGAEDTTRSKEHLKIMMAEISASIQKLSDQYGFLQSDHEDLVKKVTSCCQNRSLTLEQVEDHILVLLSDIVGLSPDGEAEGDRASKLQSWFQSYFAAKEELDGKLGVLWEKALTDSAKDASAKDAKAEEETLKQTADLVMGVVLERMRTEIKAQHDESIEVMSQLVEEKTKQVAGTALSGQGHVVSGLNASAVRQIVKDALLKYDADKTGMVDHALESGGGSIVSTRCTEGFQGHQVELTMFGYSFYRYSTNTPRSLIQPDRNPGQCYAFKGSQGFVVIQFVGPVRMTGFTLEHIPKVLTPSGSIDSAPKEFSVYGLQTTEEEGFHFGNFVYSDEGEPLQYFPVQNKSEEFFKYVELKIHSNHGNMQYTCVYRFRVHGVRQF